MKKILCNTRQAMLVQSILSGSQCTTAPMTFKNKERFGLVHLTEDQVNKVRDAATALLAMTSVN